VSVVVSSWEDYQQREFRSAFRAAAEKGKDFIEAVIRLKDLTIKKADLTWQMVAEDLGYTADALDARIWRHQNSAKAREYSDQRPIHRNPTPNGVSSRRNDDFPVVPESIKQHYIPMGKNEKGENIYAMKGPGWGRTEPENIDPDSEFFHPNATTGDYPARATTAEPLTETTYSKEWVAIQLVDAIEMRLGGVPVDERRDLLMGAWRILINRGFIPRQSQATESS
jgi:hypothetical protein